VQDLRVKIEVLQGDARALTDPDAAACHQHRHKPQFVRVGVDDRSHLLISPRLDPAAVPGPGLGHHRGPGRVRLDQLVGDGQLEASLKDEVGAGDG